MKILQFCPNFVQCRGRIGIAEIPAATGAQKIPAKAKLEARREPFHSGRLINQEFHQAPDFPAQLHSSAQTKLSKGFSFSCWLVDGSSAVHPCQECPQCSAPPAHPARNPLTFGALSSKNFRIWAGKVFIL